jgi:3-methyladenine DNA glycosylase AlkD
VRAFFHEYFIAILKDRNVKNILYLNQKNYPMKKDLNAYIAKLRALLEANTDPVYAAKMKKYMRNKFEFFGINSPIRKILFRSFVKDQGWPAADDLEQVCLELYAQSEREFHYFAMEMAERNLNKFNESPVKLFEFMIVTNAWWDTVDFIAANILGRFFRLYPGLIRDVTKEWMDSENIWLQRSCILFQLKYKKSTDTDLLYSFIERLNNSYEFFIQKAIGWILREYSKVNPEEVLKYTGKTVLKPLSRKEALRIIKKKELMKFYE